MPPDAAFALAVTPLDAALGNADIGVLLDAPLLINPPAEDLVLTSDQWASLLHARRTAGRALHLAEVPSLEEHGRDVGAAVAGIDVPQGTEGEGRRCHGRHRARLSAHRATMKRAAFRGAA